MSQNFVLSGSILVLSGLHDSCWRAPCKHKNEIFGGQNPQFFWPAGADVNADVDDDVDDDDDDDDEAAFTALGTTPQLLPNKAQSEQLLPNPHPMPMSDVNAICVK